MTDFACLVAGAFSTRDLLGYQPTQAGHPTKLGKLRMLGAAVSMSVPLLHPWWDVVRVCAYGRVAPQERLTCLVSNLGLLRPGAFSRVRVPSPRPMAPSADGVGPSICVSEHVAILRCLAGRFRG